MVVQPRGRRIVSAMVRVRNEEDFLSPSLESIVEFVDQIVIIDNRSTDRTWDIATEFRDRFSTKVKLLKYDHEIARPGLENAELARTTSGRRSPRLLANFYDWCVAHCDGTHILKWDGDMVATNDFGPCIDRFRMASEQTLWITGWNVYPDLSHLTTGDSPPPLEPWEARIFPKRFARHNNRLVAFENLQTPYKHWPFAVFIDKPVYLHLRLCKRDPNANRSDNLWSTPQQGEPLPAAAARCVEEWHLRCPQSSARV